MLRNFIRKISLSLNYVMAIALGLCYISAYINPSIFWPAAFWGLLFPILLFINIAFMGFWGFYKPKRIFISLIAILMGWNFISRAIQLSGDNTIVKKENSVKISSYNVRLFNKYGWKENVDVSEKLINFLLVDNNDILCLQEYDKAMRNKFSSQYKGNKHYAFQASAAGEKQGFGLAVFSKYPIIARGSVHDDQQKIACLYTDIVLPKDTIRVYNCHLQSIHLWKKDYEFLDSVKLKYNPQQMEGIRKISGKLKAAFISRSQQAGLLHNHIKSSPHPVVVCGDFNDTPMSYAYQKVKGELQDAFVESGAGISSTYAGKSSPFRIDFIFYDKSMQSKNYQRTKVNYSDHYPISCDLVFSSRK